LNNWLVDFICMGHNGLQHHHFLEVDPELSRVRRLPWPSVTAPHEFFDRWLYMNRQGISVWISHTGEVWRVAPGQKPLRLNPPAPH
jgi:hypothetical protein